MNLRRHGFQAVGVALALAACGAGGAMGAADGVVDVAAFGARSGDGSDTTPAVRAALEAVRATKARRLVFPPGRYDFQPDRASEKYWFISNNDEGLKRVVFPLADVQDLEIDGQGAQFVFHGYVCPFTLDHARNITLRNFSIDWKRTFHSEAKILAVAPGALDLEFAEAFPFKIERGILLFTGEGKETYPCGGLLEFDPVKRETAWQAHDCWVGAGVLAESIGTRRVRLAVPPKYTATAGNVLVFGPNHRLCPAITIADSANVRIEDVNLYHCGGMGVIAQRSADLALRRVKVTPAPGSGRVVSLTADATHFVNCTGRIEMSDCLFENQKDDATNIHGIYAQVTGKPSPDTLEVRLRHPQQHGFDFIEPGLRLELVHGPGIVTFGEAVAKSVRRVNKEITEVAFEGPLPAETAVGDAVASLKGYPEVEIRRCTIRGNRARGILLGSRAKTVIEDNLFHTAGAAILLEGDARFWFEQAGVRDLLVRSNRFENCNYGVWGKACIEVGSGIEATARSGSRYNRGILIEDNTFRIFNPAILRMYCVDGLTFRRNRIEKSSDYAVVDPTAKAFDISDSSNVSIEGMP